MYLRINVRACLWVGEWCTVGQREERGETETKQREESGESVNSVLQPSLVLVALCLHGAHILSGEVLSSLVWPDLFTLQARLQLSNTYQKYLLCPWPSLCHQHILASHSLCAMWYVLLLTVFIILAYTPICLTSKVPPSFASILLCLSLSLTIPLTMQVKAAGAVYFERAM